VDHKGMAVCLTRSDSAGF